MSDKVTSINKKSQLAANNRYLFESAEKASGHRDYVRNALMCSRYYAGDQWDAEVKAQLDAEKRPALTLNMVLSTVNAMIGEQLERKVDVAFHASRNGTEDTAFALNTITRAILGANSYNDVEEQVFADGIITDRGFFDVRLSFENNIEGEIVITSEDGVDIIIDGEAKEYDPSTWRQVFISRWMTPDDIAVEFGEKYKDRILTLAMDSEAGSSTKHFEFSDRTFGQDTGHTSTDVEERAKVSRVRVVERQHFVYTDVYKYVDQETGDMRQIPYGVDLEEAKAFAEDNGYLVLKTKGKRLRVTTSCADVLLSDDWSIYRTFTIIPFFPYFMRGRPHGVVRHLLDPQDLLNKTSSQELHIVNTTANSGWVVQEGSLVDMDADDLEERGAETGLVLQYKRGYEAPDKITPNQIPTGIDRISQKAAATIREISAINASMLGTGRADQSGKAQQLSTMRGQVQVSVVLNNLKRARRMVTRKILELVQDFYTETRYFKATDEGVVSTSADQASVAINEPDDDGNILNDVTVGEYGFTVSHVPNGGSTHDMEFNEATRLREAGVAIPDHFMVKYSNLREREQLSEFIKQMNGFGEQTEEEQQLQQIQQEFTIMQLEKTLQDMDASIAEKQSKAELNMANAESKEGMNEMQLEVAKLRQERDLRSKELALRISLSARGHANSQQMNDKRLAAQIATKTMEQMASREKDKSQQQQKKTG